MLFDVPLNDSSMPCRVRHPGISSVLAFSIVLEASVSTASVPVLVSVVVGCVPACARGSPASWGFSISPRDHDTPETGLPASPPVDEAVLLHGLLRCRGGGGEHERALHEGLRDHRRGAGHRRVGGGEKGFKACRHADDDEHTMQWLYRFLSSLGLCFELRRQ